MFLGIRKLKSLLQKDKNKAQTDCLSFIFILLKKHERNGLPGGLREWPIQPGFVRGACRQR
jgi:hypothetical protein